MKLTTAAKFILFLSLISMTACVRKGYYPNGAPAGFVSESECLRLISGQEVRRTNVAAKGAGETCHCEHCALKGKTTASRKASAAVPASKAPAVAKRTVVAKKQLVTTKITQPRITQPRVAVSRDADSARASLNVHTSTSPVITAPQSKISETRTVVETPRRVVAVTETKKVEVKAAPVNKNLPGDARIRSIQAALNEKGAKLEIDGAMGDRTVRLIKAFQTMNDIPVTGEVDSETAKALGVSE